MFINMSSYYLVEGREIGMKWILMNIQVLKNDYVSGVLHVIFHLGMTVWMNRGILFSQSY